MSKLRDKLLGPPTNPRPPDRRDREREAADTIARATAAGRVGSFRVGWSRLDDDDRAALTDLTMKAATGGGLLDLSRLDQRELARWERLAAVAAGHAPDFFDQGRELAKVSREARKALAEVRRPNPRPRVEEPGSVTLPSEVFNFLYAKPRVLNVEHLGLLAIFLEMFETGESRLRGIQVEGEGDALELVIDARRSGLNALAKDNGMARWRTNLDHLARNQFFEVDGRGPVLRVRLGARGLRIRRGHTTPRAKKAA